MAVRNPARRDLVFRNLDEITEDVRMLNEKGYRPVGNWNLSQACGHVNNWAQYAMVGFPMPNLPMRCLLWLMKVSFGKKQLKKVLETGTMKEGLPTMPKTVPAVDAHSDTEAVNEIAQTIENLKSHGGPWHPSPLFGEMNKDIVTQLTLIHAGHHLSFLIPTE